MKSKFLVLIFAIITQISFGQTPPPKYYDLVKKAFSLYEAKDYKTSALTYSEAFKSFGWLGLIDDRYNAACSWALAGVADSAFFNLNRIVSKGYYTNYDHIINDADLNSLHSDKRWQPLLEMVKANKEKKEAHLNKPLVHELDTIFKDDQGGRLMIDSIQKKFGNESKEMQEFWRVQNKKDSIDLAKTEEIIDNHGWLGADSIGEMGNITLFLVIQHADLKTQEKYLPIMKEAVKHGKAQAADLALLIDRVEMYNGRPQIYGSQISMNKDGTYGIYKITDEPNVNKRRAAMGLPPLEEYAKYWNIDYKLPSK